MSDLIQTAEAADPAAKTLALSVVHTTTKEELLSRARTAIEAGEQSMHDAADALGLAQEEHSATQREMAQAVGKSASWVNALLKWRRSGYKDDSPFGPKTKAGRVQHAEQLARVRSKSEAPARGAAAARRDGRRAEDALQLYRVVEEIKKLVSAPDFDNRERELFRRNHSPHLDGFIDERGRCRFEASQFTAVEPTLISPAEDNGVSPGSAHDVAA